MRHEASSPTPYTVSGSTACLAMDATAYDFGYTCTSQRASSLAAFSMGTATSSFCCAGCRPGMAPCTSRYTPRGRSPNASAPCASVEPVRGSNEASGGESTVTDGSKPLAACGSSESR